eukprot:TRINITY_DN5800_c0_g1_i1.p2 TRINITY_DN5800_c0_g1~~TRINITY_DN5800_c0_g1_i1.p2  ORF type:complete len:122 (+),score=11.96 TRINITY_DN5800_c0_g1_i1:45-410(+)
MNPYYFSHVLMNRVPPREQHYIQSTMEQNPGFFVGNPNSFAYDDVISHIAVQRRNHQYASYDYRTNQMIKHAFEDGYLTRSQLYQHTNQMESMSPRDAFSYAVQHLDFAEKHVRGKNPGKY